MRSLVVLILSLPLLSDAQWNKISFPTTEFLWKVRFATEQIGWIAGHNHLFRTTNGGQNWAVQDTSIGSCDALAVVDANTAIFANWTGAGEKSRGFRRTTDGGATWTTADAEKNYYTDIEFPTASVGYASSGGTTGNARLVKKTTDGGATWTTISQNFPKGKYELTGIAFPDAQNGWTVTYDGFVYRTTNGGTDWIYQDSLGSNSFRDIDFLDKNYGWIVGGISGFQKTAYTTNGGTSWTLVSLNGSSTREVEIVDSNNVWFAGSNNGPPFIAHYDTIGGSWKTQDINDKFIGVESIDMLNTKTGYAVGGQGLVYKTTNGGALSVRPEQVNSSPADFSLAQNFPNPFNPSTTIRFSLPSDGYASLKIYSVTGGLIEEIVHQTLDAGTYHIQWNAQAVPSGVYFYTLTSGRYSETKKLMLLK